MSATLLTFLLCYLFAKSESACTIDSNLRGLWMSTQGFKLEFFAGSYIHTYQDDPYTMECYHRVDSNTYVYRGNFSQDTTHEYEFSCIHYEMLSTTRYAVSQLTDDGINVETEKSDLNVSDICTRGVKDVPVHMKSVYWKKGVNDYMECPSELQTIWSYQAEGEDSGITTCNNKSRMDVCTNKNKIQYDLTKCPTVLVNASMGELGCLTHFSNNTLQYVILKNPAFIDGSACMVYKNSKATIRGGVCAHDQNETFLGSIPKNVKQSLTYMNFKLTLSKVMDTCLVSASISTFVPSMLVTILAAVLAYRV